MFAIVEIYGKQYKVAKGDKVLVNSKIDVAEGKTIKFDRIKLLYRIVKPDNENGTNLTWLKGGYELTILKLVPVK